MPRSAEYDLIISAVTFEWTPVDDVIKSLIYKVQPGKAVREYEARFQLSIQNRSGAAAPKGPLPQEQQLVSGAKSLLRKGLRSAINSDNVAAKEVEGVQYVRKNFFTAEEVDSILATHVAQAAIPQLPNPEPIVRDHAPDRLVYLDEMMFDIRTVQQIKVTAQRNNVNVVLDNVIDGEALHLSFTSVAADWLSDQLGFQALAARKGEENPRKAIRAYPQS